MDEDRHEDRHKTVKHAAEVLALLGCGALAAVAVLPGMGLPAWGLPALAFAAGIVSCLSIWSHSGRGNLSLYTLFFGLFLGSWLIWAEATKVWNVVTVAAWTAGMIVFMPWGVLAVLTATRPRLAQIEAPKRDEDAEHQAEMRRFETMFADAGQEGIKVTKLSEERSGRVLRLELPDNGKVTLSSLQAVQNSFEVTLKAQPGAVEFAHGSHSGEIIMRVREKYVLNETRRLTKELLATTVRDPFAIGIQEDGSTLKITVRELHMFIVGTTGAGKSNLINVIITQLASCVDTIIWVIDMKGGRTARPWLQAWGEGKAVAPAIDWVATTREEAALMMQCFIRAIESRMNSQIGGSKITPSASMPQIILVCDETADILGMMRGKRSQVGEEGTTNTAFNEMAETIAQKGRSEAGSSIWATQRGTQDSAGSSLLKSLCKLRVALGASTEADLRYVIPDARNAQRLMAIMEDIPGIGVIAVRKKSSMLTKFFWHDHIEGVCGEEDAGYRCVPECPVYQSSIEVGPRRPRLDTVSSSALGENYSGRWQRAGHLVNHRTAATTAVADVDISDFDDIMAHGMKDPENKVNPAQVRYREILAARGAMGASPKYLLDSLKLEGFTIVRETLQRWLRDDAKAGLVHSADFGRWKIGPDRKARAA